MLLKKLTDFKEGYDSEQTINEIGGSIQFRGFNLLILICAAFLASIGLDTNSAAVIIGAMLISPLMSPILGVGLAVGINDREMLISSIKNLSFATFIALSVSCIYFLLTPLGIATSEIVARTQPTLLDVLVAFFGGVAGIVAGARKDKTNAIPGVAIATALMPPLCTAGYGIASHDWRIFFGAFYLFFINAVFISLSTYLIVKYLDFPAKSYVDQNKATRVHRAMIFFLVLIVSPSIFFLFQVYKKVKIKRQVEQAVIHQIEKLSENQVLSWEILDKDSVNEVKVYEAGNEIPESTINELNNQLAESGLKNYRIKIFRVNISKDEVAEMSKAITKDYLDKVVMDNKMLYPQKPEVEKTPIENYKEIYSEVRTLHPEINDLVIGKMVSLTGTDSLKSLDYLQVSIVWKGKLNKTQQKELKERFQKYFGFKLKPDTVKVDLQ